MNTIVKQIEECLTTEENVIYYFRIQNYHRGLREYQLFSSAFQQLIHLLVNSQQLLDGYDVDFDYVLTMLQGIIQAQESKDYILTADLLELQVKPFLLGIQEWLLGQFDVCPEDEIWEDNINNLTQKDKTLAEQIIKKQLTGMHCEVEPTSSGLFTLKVMDGMGERYMHSNVNPVEEADMFAREYYSTDYSRYIIFGLGLGYHIDALLNLDDGIEIEIIEPDMEIIKTALASRRMNWLMGNMRVRLVYDPDFTKLARSLEEDSRLIIHYPSLLHIQDERMRLALEKYFIRDSGKRNMAIAFENNFRENVINCSNYVDGLEPMFKGKNAVIVAAGPSLDKNVRLLKEKPDNAIIVAVGTVFHKLMGLGIIPDCVVFLDAQCNMTQQIKGLENELVPIVCASTAYKGIAMNYKGSKYLICQKGYDRAEQYAMEHQVRTYETGGSVSTIALDMCLQLGCREIAYIGLDLAFTGNRTHANDTACVKDAPDEDVLSVESTDGKMVSSSRLFMIYREWIERRVQQVDAEGRVYDATEGGAKKKGLITKSLHELFDKWNNGNVDD